MDSSRELLGDIDHKVDFSSAITAENHLKPGSLKITKNVTVNNLEPSGNTAGLADGTYYFTVTGKEGTPTAGEQSRTECRSAGPTGEGWEAGSGMPPEV